jgi:sugar lactone lactonase YvrE
MWLLLSLGVVSFLGNGQTRGLVTPINDAPNPYRIIKPWGTLPAGRVWGSTNAIAVDGDGHVWVGERCGGNTCAGSDLPPILEFDAEGTLLRSFGQGLFVVPHGFCFAPGVVWVTDSGPPSGDAPPGKGFQVLKFSRDGKLLLRVGRPGVSQAAEDSFIAPTGCAVAKNGDIFISDGHDPRPGARVVQFSAAGKFVKTIAQAGSAPGQVSDPHGIAIDSRGRLFVANRGNNSVDIFEQDGRLIAQWPQFSRPSGVFVSRNDVLYVADSSSGLKIRSETPVHPGWKMGVRIGSTMDGTVTNLIDGSDPEGVAVDDHGVVYGAFVAQRGLARYVRE